MTRPSRMRWWIAAAVVLLGLVFASRVARPPRAARPTPSAPLAVETMVQRQRAAMERREWGEALDWAEQIARTDPRNASFVLALGVACHNLAWDAAASIVPDWRARTSIDRHLLESQAMSLVDSASRLARAPVERSAILTWRGRLLELEGLPVEAREAYREALALYPEAPGFVEHLRSLDLRLAHPGTP